MQSQSIVTTLESVRSRKGLALRQLSMQEAETAQTAAGTPRASGEPTGLAQQLAQRRLDLADLAEDLHGYIPGHYPLEARNCGARSPDSCPGLWVADSPECPPVSSGHEECEQTTAGGN